MDPRLFWPKMALAIARAIYGAKKVSGPSKSLDFVPGPFRILEFSRVDFIMSRHIYSTWTLIVITSNALHYVFHYENKYEACIESVEGNR